MGIEMVFHQCEYEYDLLSELFVSKSLDNMDIQDLLDQSAINMTKWVLHYGVNPSKNDENYQKIRSTSYWIPDPVR